MRPSHTVAAKENCFHEPSKTIKTVRISKFIRQRVPDCRAGIVERPTAVRAESTARHSETVPCYLLSANIPDFKFGLYIHRVHPNKSPSNILEKRESYPGKLHLRATRRHFPYGIT